MDSLIRSLRERFAQLDDEALVRIIGEEASDYRPEAIELARQELSRRGLDTKGETTKVRPPSEPTEASDEALFDSEEETAESDLLEPDVHAGGVTCPGCGQPLRSAVLLGETQVIAVFEDNREARFVRILVCPRCGTADMFVDMNTDVGE